MFLGLWKNTAGYSKEKSKCREVRGTYVRAGSSRVVHGNNIHFSSFILLLSGGRAYFFFIDKLIDNYYQWKLWELSIKMVIDIFKSNQITFSFCSTSYLNKVWVSFKPVWNYFKQVGNLLRQGSVHWIRDKICMVAWVKSKTRLRSWFSQIRRAGHTVMG